MKEPPRGSEYPNIRLLILSPWCNTITNHRFGILTWTSSCPFANTGSVMQLRNQSAIWNPIINFVLFADIDSVIQHKNQLAVWNSNINVIAVCWYWLRNTMQEPTSSLESYHEPHIRLLILTPRHNARAN